MLSVRCNVSDDNMILYPGVTFDYVYEDSWFESDVVRDILKDIDNTEYIGGSVFRSDLGIHTAKQLSGGVKTLILMYIGYGEGKYYPLSWLGENCYKYLDKVSEGRTIHLDLDTIPKLKDLGCVFVSEENGSEIKNTVDLVKEYVTYAEQR